MFNEFTANLKQRLAQNIKGNISVHITNDMLIVEIEAPHYVCYRYTQANILEQLLYGLSAKKLSSIITKKYTAYVLKKFIK